MGIRLTLAILAAAALARPSMAHSEPGWRDFSGVTNTSYVEPNGDRAIQLSIDVPAPRQAVFDAIATADGFRSWAVPVAAIDLRIGGIIESNYNASASIGDRENIKNEIVAYLPGRMLALRNVQSPPTFANSELFQRTATIIEFNIIDANNTRVTITNAGYGRGEGFARLYDQFEWADAFSLAELRARFERGPVDWAQRAPQAAAASATAIAEGRR